MVLQAGIPAGHFEQEKERPRRRGFLFYGLMRMNGTPTRPALRPYGIRAPRSVSGIFNRQLPELKIDVTRTKQTIGLISNHGIYRFYKIACPPPDTRKVLRAFSDHSSLTTNHCFPNRQLPELESPVTHTKQSIGSFLIANFGACSLRRALSRRRRSYRPASLASSRPHPLPATRVPRSIHAISNRDTNVQ